MKAMKKFGSVCFKSVALFQGHTMEMKAGGDADVYWSGSVIP